VRILGTGAVVVNHVCDMYLDKIATLPQATWWSLNFIDAAMRWAVPAYIMLSGALLLSPERNQTPQTFYKKRLGRIGIPLVFWTAFFIWFSYHYLVPRHWVTPTDIWWNLAEGKPYTHLHFIFRIAGLYAFTPVFRIFLRHASRAMQIGTVVLCLALACGDSVLGAFNKSELSIFMRFLPFVGYYLLGYLLREAYVSRWGLLWSWFGFLASIAALAGVTGWIIARHGGKFEWYPSPQMMFYDFLSPIRIVMAICAWLIFVNSFRHPYPWKRGRNVVYWWASATLGLYLIHPAFRELLYIGWTVQKTGQHYAFDALHPFGGAYANVWLGIPVTTLLIYVPSLILILIIMRIPLLRRIAG
jgi:surface polysaccharide O-acyltransferase-like enzyme